MPTRVFFNWVRRSRLKAENPHFDDTNLNKISTSVVTQSGRSVLYVFGRGIWSLENIWQEFICLKSDALFCRWHQWHANIMIIWKMLWTQNRDIAATLVPGDCRKMATPLGLIYVVETPAVYLSGFFQRSSRRNYVPRAAGYSGSARRWIPDLPGILACARIWWRANGAGSVLAHSGTPAYDAADIAADYKLFQKSVIMRRGSTRIRALTLDPFTAGWSLKIPGWNKSHHDPLGSANNWSGYVTSIWLWLWSRQTPGLRHLAVTLHQERICVDINRITKQSWKMGGYICLGRTGSIPGVYHQKLSRCWNKRRRFCVFGACCLSLPAIVRMQESIQRSAKLRWQ